MLKLVIGIIIIFLLFIFYYFYVYNKNVTEFETQTVDINDGIWGIDKGGILWYLEKNDKSWKNAEMSFIDILGHPSESKVWGVGQNNVLYSNNLKDIEKWVIVPGKFIALFVFMEKYAGIGIDGNIYYSQTNDPSDPKWSRIHL